MSDSKPNLGNIFFTGKLGEKKNYLLKCKPKYKAPLIQSEIVAEIQFHFVYFSWKLCCHCKNRNKQFIAVKILRKHILSDAILLASNSHCIKNVSELANHIK